MRDDSIAILPSLRLFFTVTVVALSCLGSVQSSPADEGDCSGYNGHPFMGTKGTQMTFDRYDLVPFLPGHFNPMITLKGQGALVTSTTIDNFPHYGMNKLEIHFKAGPEPNAFSVQLDDNNLQVYSVKEGTECTMTWTDRKMVKVFVW